MDCNLIWPLAAMVPANPHVLNIRHTPAQSRAAEMLCNADFIWFGEAIFYYVVRIPAVRSCREV